MKVCSHNLHRIHKEVYDLLQPGGGQGFSKNNLRFHEWEGAMVQGIQWLPVPSAHQLTEFFNGGVSNKTQRVTDVGNLRDKASQLFQIEIIQNNAGQLQGEAKVNVSRVSVLNLPDCWVLNRDPEEVRAKEGPTLNKGILATSNLLRDLAATPQGDYANYDDSIVTALSRDIFGGNSLCVGIFCLKYGDQIGSTMTMRALKRCQNIMNFPV